METAARMPTSSKATGVTLPRDIDTKQEGSTRVTARRTSLPSEEYEGCHPGDKSGGVGSLPGHLSESSVVLLPDERGKSRLYPYFTDERAKEGTETSAHETTYPPSEPSGKKGIQTSTTQSTKTGKQPRRTSRGSEGEQDPNPPKRRGSLKEKVTEGMKAAMGKLMKDEETFTEGQTQRGH